MEPSDHPVPVSPGPTDAADLRRWQQKMLPFATRFLLFTAVAFFVFSALDAYQLRNLVGAQRTGAVDRIHQVLGEQRPGPGGWQSADTVQRSLLMLEADAIDRRYRQASALLMSRIWTRQLAFLTGMVLAFVGSVFILSKLREDQTQVNLGFQGWKGGIASASPGLVLAFLGVALMLTSLVVQPRIEVQDTPVYFVTMGLVPGKAAPAQGTPQAAPPEKPVDPDLLDGETRQ